MWFTHESGKPVTNTPPEPHAFYPVYRWRGFYSYSYLALLQKKGYVALNPQHLVDAKAPGFLYSPLGGYLDSEIERLGAALPNRLVKDNYHAESFLRALAIAIRLDVAEIEESHPRFTNVIMCGGKDSLNLLLLPWKNPVLVASGMPNYPLVKEFIAANRLPFDCVELPDDPPRDPEREILVNCRRNNLTHCRWTDALIDLANTLNRRAIFWKGQAADALLSPIWKYYADYSRIFPPPLQAKYESYGEPGKWKMRRILGWLGLDGWRTQLALWQRGAQWQGVHVGFLREITDTLFLSAYHGPRANKIFTHLDFARIVTRDLGSDFGETLAGKPVWYPNENPPLIDSLHRDPLNDLDRLLRALSANGLEIREPKTTQSRLSAGHLRYGMIR